jgi:hypothetical protein
MTYNTMTEIAIDLVCEGKNPYSRGVDYDTYAQLQHQLNYELNNGVFSR